MFTVCNVLNWQRGNWINEIIDCRSAFFYGQIEVQRKGLTAWLPRPDLPILVAINGTGVTIIDPEQSVSRDFASFYSFSSLGNKPFYRTTLNPPNFLFLT